MRKQPAVGRVRGPDLEQLVGAPLELCDAQSELLGVDELLLALVAQRQPVEQDEL